MINIASWTYREDVWLPCGRLFEFLSYRFIYSQEFDSQTSARDIIHAFTDGWPNDWIARCPLLATIPLPSLHETQPDKIYWRDKASNLITIETSIAYTSIDGISDAFLGREACGFLCISLSMLLFCG